MPRSPDEVMNDLRKGIRRTLRAGFTPAHQIVEIELEVLEEEDDRARLRRAAEQMLDEESRAMLREQAAWPAVTDCDRLDRAFAALERRGIVARQNFSCCQNCGSQEIWGEVDDAANAGMPVRGHTYYHAQDAEGAAEGHGLSLSYDSLQEGGTAEVGREVVAALNEHGLPTEWNGSPAKRIYVPLDWKRRRHDL